MSEAQKVYVITSGSYSDYSIRGVCSTREKAEKVCELRNGVNIDFNDSWEIEEWVLDGESDSDWRQAYRCAVAFDTGEVAYRGNTEEWVTRTERGSVNDSSDAWFCRGRYFYATSYESELHALSLATEARQAALRKQIEHSPLS